MKQDSETLEVFKICGGKGATLQCKRLVGGQLLLHSSRDVLDIMALTYNNH